MADIREELKALTHAELVARKRSLDEETQYDEWDQAGDELRQRQVAAEPRPTCCKAALDYPADTCVVLDGGYYCDTCKERSRECNCLPPTFAWEPV